MRNHTTKAAWRPLFVTGTARSGSTLLSQMLSAHRDITVASDPYLPIFRSLRNAIVDHATDAGLKSTFDPTAPLQDYYFSAAQLRVMDLIQTSDLQVPCNAMEWESLLAACRRRAGAASPDLVPGLPSLQAPTYAEMCERGLQIIANARQAQGGKWVGCKEVWTIEFFAPLARTYPHARFIVIMRDPRAILASMQAIATLDPSQAAHSLSYARHWRKYVAFIEHYRNDPLLANRLCVVQFEHLVRAPEKTVQALCDFLNVRYDPGMLDPQNYYDFSTGTVWQGNSSFAQTLSTISVHQTERWRHQLHPHARKMVDFICGPDMQLAGYAPLTHTDTSWPEAEILDCIIRNEREYCSWRSNVGDPQQDYGFELFRRSLLTLNGRSLDRALLRRSFLFAEVFTRLHQHPAALAEAV